MSCKDFQNSIPNLLLTQDFNPDEIRRHLESCASCRSEYASFQSTFSLLNDWQAPEPSSYFDQKFSVLLREEMAAPPAGWFESLRSRILFSTGSQFRPVLAGTFAVILLVGGGTFASLSSFAGHSGNSQISNTVVDLQILDKNDQALQQMDQLLQDDQSIIEETPVAPRS